MIYRLIAQLQRKAGDVASLCRLQGVSRSGYYAARSRQRQPTRVCPPAVELLAAFMASGRSSGSRRLCAVLRSRSINIGLHRVRTIMRKHFLRPVWKRRFIRTMNNSHTLPIAGNVLDRNFNPMAMNVAWVSDITYIPTRTGWSYLAAVMDLHPRKIVGWAMAPSMPARLVCAAFQMAIAHRHPPAGLVVHSDRECQYASEEHRSLLKRPALMPSMSRKGNFWDNAVMERFFLNLKMERAWHKDYANHREASSDVTDYIVAFYNDNRLHSKLGYCTPTVFENRNLKIKLSNCPVLLGLGSGLKMSERSYG